jgi:hypothetical protein
MLYLMLYFMLYFMLYCCISSGTASPNGAPGSYNHLINAVLDVKVTIQQAGSVAYRATASA